MTEGHRVEPCDHFQLPENEMSDIAGLESIVVAKRMEDDKAAEKEKTRSIPNGAGKAELHETTEIWL